MLHAETAIGWQIGLYCVIIISVLALIGGPVIGWLAELPLLGALGGLVVTAIVWGVFTLATWPPFSAQYHTYEPTTITVKSTSSRIISDGGGSVSQRIAIISTNGSIYGCDDTRCSTLQPGQIVTLLCTEEWEGNGVPGYVCNWGRLGRN